MYPQVKIVKGSQVPWKQFAPREFDAVFAGKVLGPAHTQKENAGIPSYRIIVDQADDVAISPLNGRPDKVADSAMKPMSVRAFGAKKRIFVRSSEKHNHTLFHASHKAILGYGGHHGPIPPDITAASSYSTLRPDLKGWPSKLREWTTEKMRWKMG